MQQRVNLKLDSNANRPGYLNICTQHHLILGLCIAKCRAHAFLCCKPDCDQPCRTSKDLQNRWALLQKEAEKERAAQAAQGSGSTRRSGNKRSPNTDTGSGSDGYEFPAEKRRRTAYDGRSSQQHVASPAHSATT